MRRKLSLAALVLCVAHEPSSAEPIRSVPTLSGAAAAMAVDAALQEAERRGTKVCVIVLDEAARFLAGRSMDGAKNSAFEVAFAKARHSANFRKPSKYQQDLLGQQAGLPILAIPGMVPLESGLPITLRQSFIGAIGVSGASSDQDGLIVAAGISALKPR